MEKKTAVLIAVLVTATVTAGVVQATHAVKHLREKAQRVERAEAALKYHVEAEKINDYYSRSKITTRAVVIRQTLEAIDKNLPNYFKDGPYTRRDLIAIAMVESYFNQYLVGKHKEYGIFQLLPSSAEWAGVSTNHFDIEVNTQMALFVLKKKHDQHKDYKMGIIAYNGVVKSRGKISEVYWDKFVKARNAVDDILGDNSLPNK
jgi:hypothetical protein